MKTATFSELRERAKYYFDAVEQGEKVQILRHGHIIATIVPAKNEEKYLSWQRPALRLKIKGVSLTKEILKERREEE